MKPDEDNASMDSILASIRRIIASEPDPMPENMENGDSLTTSRTRDVATSSGDKSFEPRGSILELKNILEKRQVEEEQSQDRPRDAEYEVLETLESDFPSKQDSRKQNHQEETLGEGFEVFLRSTLERIVVDFLKTWADENIPRLAERILREEIKNTFDHGSATKRRVS